MKVTVYFNPKDVKPTVIQNATVVLADILRASTMVPTLLYHGAAAVMLCPDPGTAKKAFEKLKRGEGMLAGERDWQKIPGFHLGGSPLDSSRDKVKDRTVCFSTPSPLRVLKNAKHLVMGSFVNLTEVYDSCLRGKRDVVIVCAGGMEDSAFAGMLADFLQSTLGSTPIALAESAKEAVALYKPWQGRLAEMFQESPEGKALTQKGFAKDLEYCAKVNKISAVPYLKGDLFLKEDTPKRKWLEEVKKPIQKGKSIKITAPLFPKNPEHQMPGTEKGKKGAVPAKGADKHADKKHADKKGAPAPPPVPPKKGEVKAPGEKKTRKPAVPKPMFSKKTVATAPVKLIKKEK